MSTIVVNKPEWDRYGDEFEFRWPTYEITMRISRIRARGESISGEVAVLYQGRSVDVGRVSFLSTRERSAFAKHLSARNGGVEWGDMLTSVSAELLVEYRREEAIEDTATGEVQARSYLTEPTLKNN